VGWGGGAVLLWVIESFILFLWFVFVCFIAEAAATGGGKEKKEPVWYTV